MPTIVIGGHSRNIGKTSVAAGLIAEFAGLGWTAVKITQYGHGVCSRNGSHCGCAVDQHAYAILEERSLEGRSDTSRFLLAGARRSLWVRTKQGQLSLAMPELRLVFESEPFVIVESNSILRFISPALYIVVLKPDVEDFKSSARQFLARADAAVVLESSQASPAWQDVSTDLLTKLRLFPATTTDVVPQELKDFVRSRLL